MSAMKEALVADGGDGQDFRLGELDPRPGRAGVIVWCYRCGHEEILPVAPLVARFGPDVAVAEIGGEAGCSSCRSRDAASACHETEHNPLAPTMQDSWEANSLDTDRPAVRSSRPHHPY